MPNLPAQPSMRPPMRHGVPSPDRRPSPAPGLPAVRSMPTIPTAPVQRRQELAAPPVYQPAPRVPAPAPPPAYRPAVQAKLAPPIPVRVTPPHHAVAPGRFTATPSLRPVLQPKRIVDTRPAAAPPVLRAVPAPVLQTKTALAAGHPSVRVKIGPTPLPVGYRPHQAVQLKKDVKVVVDTQVNGSNKIIDVQINSTNLRNHWKQLEARMGDKPKPLDNFVDRHILPMEFMVAMEAQSYIGKPLSDVIPSLSPTTTISYREAAQVLEDKISKNIRRRNNEIFELSNGAEQCWHFWGKVEENSYRNNYVATTMSKLKRAIKHKKTNKANSLREALVFTWFDTPTYDWTSPWSPELHQQMAESFRAKVKGHLSTLPEFNGWTIPNDIMNRTPQRVWQDWSKDDDNDFYTPGLTESLYGPNKGKSPEEIHQMRIDDDDYYS